MRSLWSKEAARSKSGNLGLIFLSISVLNIQLYMDWNWESCQNCTSLRVSFYVIFTPISNFWPSSLVLWTQQPHLAPRQFFQNYTKSKHLLQWLKLCIICLQCPTLNLTSSAVMGVIYSAPALKLLFWPFFTAFKDSGLLISRHQKNSNRNLLKDYTVKIANHYLKLDT